VADRAPPDPQALYDGQAARWARRTPLSLSDFTARPRVLDLCEPVAGLRVLDLGCGEGYCTRLLRGRGAAEVVAIDVSPAMVAAARAEEERAPLGAIDYRVGSATDLAELPAGGFDLVLAMFLFNYLSVGETRATCQEVARVLRPDGRFVFAVPHPLLPWLRPTEPPFYFDVDGAGYASARDRRFPGRIWRRDGVALDVQVVHKTLADYVCALDAAGFTRLPRVHELAVTDEIRAIDPGFFAPLGEAPLHLAIATARPAG
jgi:SAM-dependent methyltransferase